jgi:hypothetical protein
LAFFKKSFLNRGIQALFSFLFRKSRQPDYDRRHKPRQKTRNLISIDAPHTMVLNLVNISESGLQFSSPVKLKREHILTLNINLAEQCAKIQALGQVVWIKRFSKTDSRMYRVGIHFMGLNKEDSAAIRRFIYSEPRAA